MKHRRKKTAPEGESNAWGFHPPGFEVLTSLQTGSPEQIFNAFNAYKEIKYNIYFFYYISI